MHSNQTSENRGCDSTIVDKASSTRLSSKLSHKVDVLNLRDEFSLAHIGEFLVELLLVFDTIYGTIYYSLLGIFFDFVLCPMCSM